MFGVDGTPLEAEPSSSATHRSGAAGSPAAGGQGTPLMSRAEFREKHAAYLGTNLRNRMVGIGVVLAAFAVLKVVDRQLGQSLKENSASDTMTALSIIGVLAVFGVVVMLLVLLFKERLRKVSIECPACKKSLHDRLVVVEKTGKCAHCDGVVWADSGQ